MRVDMTPKEYQAYVKRMQKKSPLGKDMALAFVIGGLICVAGQAIGDRHIGVPCVPVGAADGTGTLPPAGPVRRGRDAGTHHGLCQRRGVPGAGFQG